MSKSRQLTLKVMGKWRGRVDFFWVLTGSGGVMASVLLALFQHSLAQSRAGKCAKGSFMTPSREVVLLA